MKSQTLLVLAVCCFAAVTLNSAPAFANAVPEPVPVPAPAPVANPDPNPKPVAVAEPSLTGLDADDLVLLERRQNRGRGRGQRGGKKNAGKKNVGKKNVGKKNVGKKNLGKKGKKNVGKKQQGGGKKNVGKKQVGGKKNQGKNQGKKNQGKKNIDAGKKNNAGKKNAGKGIGNGVQFCNQVGLRNAIADGTQKKTPTCSVTVQGVIPSFNRMVSTIILAPQSGANIQAGSEINVAVRTANMDLGFFEDPNARYYASPQTLNGQGVIEGHQHVTVQDLGNGQNPPDPRSDALVFFKGLDQEDANGILTVTIPADATQGMAGSSVRICTMTGTRGHQPVLMPVARRGAQDDCIRVNMV